MALSAERNTPARDGRTFSGPVAAAKKCLAGGLLVFNATGYLEPATTATTKKGAGRCKATVDNTSGSNGDQTVEYERGVFRFANNGDVTRAHINGLAYAVDDETVAPDNGTNTRSAVGTIRDVDALGVWVEF